MVDFSHLNKLGIDEKTVEYPLSFIKGEPILIVKPATEANKGYFNAVLRKSRKTLKASEHGISAKMVKDNREEDRELYPMHVIVGWKDVLDSGGKPVKYSEKNSIGFIAALPPWIFDEIRTFCGKASNFAEEQIDIEEKAGN